jgi:hypothetical protein
METGSRRRENGRMEEEKWRQEAGDGKDGDWKPETGERKKRYRNGRNNKEI